MSKAAIQWPKGQSRYMVLADQLLSQIQQGQYKPGDYLPAEAQLCSAYGVSRFTARQAIQELKRQGVITTHHGIGSQVLRTSPADGEFSFSFNSVDDFVESAKGLKLEVTDSTSRIADDEIAAILDCPAGTDYVCLEGRRVTKKDGEPVAQVELIFPERYASVASQLGRRRAAVSRQFEEKFGLRTAQILQTIEPVSLRRRQAEALEVPQRSAGLLVCRTYIDASRSVFLHVRNIHAGKFSRLSMEIRRQSE